LQPEIGVLTLEAGMSSGYLISSLHFSLAHALPIVRMKALLNDEAEMEDLFEAIESDEEFENAGNNGRSSSRRPQKMKHAHLPAIL
jgi:hypothetical protein